MNEMNDKNPEIPADNEQPGARDGGGNEVGGKPKIKPGRVDGKNSAYRSGSTHIRKQLRNEIIQILHANRDKGANKEKRVGNRTIAIRETVVLGFFADLMHLKYRIETVHNLKQKHLEAVFNFLEDQGQAPSTIQNKISIIRTFCEWIGKAGMVKDSYRYVKDKSSVRRTTVVQEDKSWVGKELDVMAEIGKVMAEDQSVGIMLELIFAFGLRRAEGIMLRPSASTDGDFLWVREGTKGDRPRVVPIENAVQADVLLRAIELEDGKTGFLGKRGKTLEQKTNRFTYVMKKCGITLAAEGVTAHGLRHQYMHDSFKLLTGVEAPIKGGDISTIPEGKLRDALRKLMERAGHTRTGIGPAYYGSIRKKKRRSDWSAPVFSD